jgi:hypothetical protein
MGEEGCELMYVSSDGGFLIVEVLVVETATGGATEAGLD